jgi:hypothetical protein
MFWLSKMSYNLEWRAFTLRACLDARGLRGLKSLNIQNWMVRDFSPVNSLQSPCSQTNPNAPFGCWYWRTWNWIGFNTKSAMVLKWDVILLFGCRWIRVWNCAVYFHTIQRWCSVLGEGVSSYSPILGNWVSDSKPQFCVQPNNII